MTEGESQTGNERYHYRPMISEISLENQTHPVPFIARRGDGATTDRRNAFYAVTPRVANRDPTSGRPRPDRWRRK